MCAQAQVPATRAQVIYSLTPIWSALMAAWLLGDEGLGPVAWAGCAAICAASILASRAVASDAAAGGAHAGGSTHAASASGGGQGGSAGGSSQPAAASKGTSAAAEAVAGVEGAEGRPGGAVGELPQGVGNGAASHGAAGSRPVAAALVPEVHEKQEVAVAGTGAVAVLAPEGSDDDAPDHGHMRSREPAGMDVDQALQRAGTRLAAAEQVTPATCGCSAAATQQPAGSALEQLGAAGAVADGSQAGAMAAASAAAQAEGDPAPLMTAQVHVVASGGEVGSGPDEEGEDEDHLVGLFAPVTDAHDATSNTALQALSTIRVGDDGEGCAPGCPEAVTAVTAAAAPAPSAARATARQVVGSELDGPIPMIVDGDGSGGELGASSMEDTVQQSLSRGEVDGAPHDALLPGAESDTVHDGVAGAAAATAAAAASGAGAANEASAQVPAAAGAGEAHAGDDIQQPIVADPHTPFVWPDLTAGPKRRGRRHKGMIVTPKVKGKGF